MPPQSALVEEYQKRLYSSKGGRRTKHSPKKNLETETTLSRLNKRLSIYETDITIRL